MQTGMHRAAGIANLGTLADAVCIIFPMMKRAADRFTLDIANREVCAEVRAVRTHYARDSCRRPIGDHSPAEEIDPYNFALGNFARQTNREPGFRKDSIFPLRRNRGSEIPTP
jgi:hypothetical protein